MTEPPSKKPHYSKEEEMSSSQGPSTSSFSEQESPPASPEGKSPPYDSFVETVINETLNAMKPSSVKIEKQPEDDIIVVNMERPCSCEICAISAELDDDDDDREKKDQVDQQPIEEKRDD
jgi:hypothetical protein